MSYEHRSKNCLYCKTLTYITNWFLESVTCFGKATILFESSNLKNKSKSSQEWILRQIHDPYVKMAKYKNYRARSAFKLIEMDDRFHLLKPGCNVLECGAAPGAWTQVIVERINSSKKDEKKPVGHVIAVDKCYIEPLDGAVIVSGADLTKPEEHTKLKQLLKTNPVDLVLSDMCPELSGIRQLDCERSLDLFSTAFYLSTMFLGISGNFLGKIMDENSAKKLENTLLKYFESMKIIKPPASRKNSTEVYVLCQKFKKN